MKLLSFGITKSECILSVRVYQSFPPMSLSALFWTNCRRCILDLDIKVHAEEA